MKIKHLWCISCGPITIFHAPVWGEVVWRRYDLTRWYPKKSPKNNSVGQDTNVPPSQLLAAWKTVTIYILDGQEKSSFFNRSHEKSPTQIHALFLREISPQMTFLMVHQVCISKKNDSLLIKKRLVHGKPARKKLTSCKIRIFAAASKQGIQIAVWPTWRHRWMPWDWYCWWFRNPAPPKRFIKPWK